MNNKNLFQIFGIEKRKSFFNRKGFTYGMFFVIGFLLFALTTLVFFFLFNGPEETARIEIATTAKTQDVNIILLNYLRTPVGDKTMAEIIGEYYYDDDLEEIIEEETEKIFRAINPDNQLAEYIVKIGPRSSPVFKLEVPDTLKVYRNTIESTAEVPIPGKTDDVIQVRLELGYDGDIEELYK